MTRKADPTTQAAAMLQMALRAVLLSGQAQCLDPGKQTEELDSPGATGRRTPRKGTGVRGRPAMREEERLLQKHSPSLRPTETPDRPA